MSAQSIIFKWYGMDGLSHMATTRGGCQVYFIPFRSSLISASMSMVRNLLLYLLNGSPSGPMRNFSKFQETSFLFTGLQMMNLGSPIKDTGSSLGWGSVSLRNTNRGWAFAPFTSSFSRSWNFGSKPLPGRMYFRDSRISSFLQFSCWATKIAQYVMQ